MSSDEEAKFKYFQDRLRRWLGNLTLSQFSEEQCRDCVDSALREFSKYKPIQVFDSLITTIDALYDLSDKERIIKVKRVFYATSNVFVLDEYSFWPDEISLGRLEGISIFDNPSIWVQYMQRLEQFKNIFDGDFEFDQTNKVLRLIPPPATAGRRVYYIWTQRHTAETIPSDDIDTVLLWAKGEAKEIIASRASLDIRSVSGYGQSVTFGGSPDSLMREAENFKSRFRNKFGGTVINVG